MRKKDLDAQLAEVERRRLMGKLSYEEAILAKQTLMQENRNKVAQMKKEVSQQIITGSSSNKCLFAGWNRKPESLWMRGMELVGGGDDIWLM